MGRPRIWEDGQLRQVAPGCTTLTEVVEALGLTPCNTNRARVRDHAARLGIALPDGSAPNPPVLVPTPLGRAR